MGRFILFVTLYFLIISCNVTTKINLPTDELESSSDDQLILREITKKTQAYTLTKSLYKRGARRTALKEFKKLSSTALEMYQEGSIDKEKYDYFHKEAKYVIQNSIYMMKGEPNPPSDSDVVLEYLNTGIESLKDILEN